MALGGVGPVNRAMAGAATAAPIDAAGAIHWNPASISGLQSSEVLFGMELLLPTEALSSQYGPFSGATGGEPGVTPIPSMALVHKLADSPWTLGLGMYGIAGFSVNYPANMLPGNPALSPPPPNGAGLGRIDTDAQFLQIAPVAALAISDKLSLGFGPTLTLAKLSVDPLFFVSPNAPGEYPGGSGTRYNWGGGFAAGVYYITDTSWHLGLSFQSPQWFEGLRVHTSDAAGGPRQETLSFDFPMFLSLGVAYAGIEDWLVACDVRYYDYKHTAGFGDPAGCDASGKVTGLGWESVVSVHTGVQYHATERLYLRVGYQFNENPISSAAAFFNVASPLIVQHQITTGLSYHLTTNLIFSLYYVHAFESQLTGPGPLPGYSVTSAISADALGMGFTLRY
jgi:long-chain fatty acid transport protein